MRSNVLFDKNTGQIIEERPAPKFRYLALEGGGVRGVAYAGLMDVLERGGVLSDIVHISGASVGAIAAMLLALGYSTDEGKAILESLSLKDLLEDKKGGLFTPELFRKIIHYLSAFFTSEGYSISSGDQLLTWLEDKVEKKLGKKKRNVC